MTLVLGSSAAISAACHPRADENDNAYSMPLQWGAIEPEEDYAGPGHCCFSSKEVVRPTPGEAY
ncbi:hypothetical protein GGR52DRAFT_166261 [Hypoxylon sp. FL1284]|nr:hypothetical protein GGR52DRAFT_166261 [Hypoxylon sp. FL1284]